MQIRTGETANSPVGPGAEPRTAAALGLRRVAFALAGFSVLLFGVALLVVPVPGTSVVVFPIGLAILAREFHWARRLLDRSTATARRIWAGVRRLCGARPAVRPDWDISSAEQPLAS
jgi:tellurite resistance protein TerC